MLNQLQTQTPRRPMPSIQAQDGSIIRLGDETRRLRLVDLPDADAQSLGHLAAADLWIDHARGSDRLGPITTELHPYIAAALDRAIEDANATDPPITLALVCALASKAQAEARGK